MSEQGEITMSNDKANNRINMRLTEDDTGRLRVIAADIQRRRGSPFVSPADAVREAMRLLAERIAAEGMR
jgi:hypothetical protein